MAGDMHARMHAGTVVHTMPLTKDIAAAFDIQTEKTGLMIAIQPDDAMLAKFKSGDLSAFSIAGKGQSAEVADV